MPSVLAWLDGSRDEQRRMRELLNLFAQSETLDELGIGQVRDALSDLLFPGTSTLFTRARYLLIVPWCYGVVERRNVPRARVSAEVDRVERTVIAELRKAGATDGLIGRRAGVAVKTLPSTIYWTALRRYGIRRLEEPPDGRLARQITTGDEASELADRVIGMWHATLPPAPRGFPYGIAGGLDLRRDEATWLRERILATTSGTLLAHLLDLRHRPSDASDAPWSDLAAQDTSGSVRGLLEYAELFSGAMHGAALLYNLLVAERYEASGFTTVEDPVERYRVALREWAEAVGSDRRYAAWDRSGLWRLVIEINPRIGFNHLARAFIDHWLDAVAEGSASAAVARNDVGSRPLGRLVAERERAVKRAQSRLVNERMLRSWSGASGSGRLVFRWPQVRRILCDIHDGLAEGMSDASA